MSRLFNSNSKCKKVMKNIIQALKECNGQCRLVYPEKLAFITEGEIKTFHNKEKLKGFATTKPRLHKILKRLLHTEEEIRMRQGDSRKDKPFSKQNSKQEIGKTK
jgi:hypothetical protein